MDIQTPRKVDIMLPGKGNLNSHGAWPVHRITSMIKWTRTTRLSKTTLSVQTLHLLVVCLSGSKREAGARPRMSGGGTHGKKMSKGHLPRVVYHQG